MENILNPGFSSERTPRRALLWTLLALVVIMALAIVLSPVWIIQPFKPQTSSGMELSYLLRKWSPLATLMLCIASLVMLVRLWSGSRWWVKPLLIFSVIMTGAAGWFARQNHFEWMFNPLRNTAYARAEDSSFVAPDDMVMAVTLNGEAAAYPIRQMAYHHVVQDTVGGTPIVATY